MKNLLVLAILAALAWHGYGKYQTRNNADDATIAATIADAGLASSGVTPATSHFSCDGRTHCSQMRSCAEATYFVEHCPNTKMDGNNDGVPCERQWCN